MPKMVARFLHQYCHNPFKNLIWKVFLFFLILNAEFKLIFDSSLLEVHKHTAH